MRMRMHMHTYTCHVGTDKEGRTRSVEAPQVCGRGGFCRLVELLVGESQPRLAEEILSVEVHTAAVGRRRALPARWVGGERRGGCGGGARVPELSIKNG
jgi:hypothetical protein